MKTSLLLLSLLLSGCHASTHYTNVVGDVPNQRTISEAHGVESRREASTDSTALEGVEAFGGVLTEAREEGAERVGPSATEPITVTTPSRVNVK